MRPVKFGQMNITQMPLGARVRLSEETFGPDRDKSVFSIEFGPTCTDGRLNRPEGIVYTVRLQDVKNPKKEIFVHFPFDKEGNTKHFDAVV